MEKKTIYWTSIISLVVIILGGIIVQINPKEFSIMLDDGSIRFKYSNGVSKAYSGRYLAYSDNIRPYYWNGAGYTKMSKSSKCSFGKYSNLSKYEDGDVVYIKQDICYSKGVMTRFFDINEYSLKKAFEFVPYDNSTRTKYKWYFESLDLGKGEVYLSKDIKNTKAEMDFGIINDWSKEIEKVVRVQRYLNGKMMIELRPVTGKVTYDPEIILREKEKISLDNGLTSERSFDNKSMIFEKDNKLLFNITSSTPFNYIGDFSKTKEWGYEKSGYEIIKCKDECIIKGDSICNTDYVMKGEGSLAEQKTYTDCIYYPKQIETKLIKGVNETINHRNFTTISKDVVRIDFTDEKRWNPQAIYAYDPTISNLTVGLLNCWSLDNLSDSFGISSLTNKGEAVLNTTEVKLGTGSFEFNDSANAILSNTSLANEVNPEFTLVFWYYFLDTTFDTYMISFQPNTQISYGFRTGPHFKMRFRISGTFYEQEIGTDQPDSNNWQMGILWSNGTNDRRLYLNTTIQLNDSRNITQTWSGFDDINIGALASGANPFRGNIDEVALWNRALNDTEITELYNNTAGMTCGEIIATGEGEVADTTPPTVTLNSPIPSYFNDTLSNTTFNCSATDASLVKNISLFLTDFTNASDSFKFNATNSTYTLEVSHNLTIGNFTWNCESCDALDNCGFASINRTVEMRPLSVADTCTSGLTDGIFDCADDCNIGTLDLLGLNFVLTGDGTFIGNISNYKNKTIESDNLCEAWTVGG